MDNIKLLNKFLKDELSATETYQQALNKLRDDVGLSVAESLMPLYEAHKDSVSSLQSLIQRLGGTPSEDSGSWGTWAKLVQGGANLLGKQAALKSLQEGEKKGVKDYEDALEDAELHTDISSLIKTKLLPAQQSHLRILDRLLETAA
ncbi:DUF2383 domain-containing protein [Crenothrix sp.]|uniref:DUF2383 domain-containing protein n=1 Tax=Crenothrix sp. TaxID=3100433 RepID=UPI00374CEB5B